MTGRLMVIHTSRSAMGTTTTELRLVLGNVP